MTFDTWPKTSELLKAFKEEISLVGGKVIDKSDHGGRLYVRSILPELREIRRGDNLQAGVH